MRSLRASAGKPQSRFALLLPPPLSQRANALGAASSWAGAGLNTPASPAEPVARSAALKDSALKTIAARVCRRQAPRGGPPPSPRRGRPDVRRGRRARAPSEWPDPEWTVKPWPSGQTQVKRSKIKPLTSGQTVSWSSPGEMVNSWAGGQTLAKWPIPGQAVKTVVEWPVRVQRLPDGQPSLACGEPAGA